jgi:hypothetical protein
MADQRIEGVRLAQASQRTSLYTSSMDRVGRRVGRRPFNDTTVAQRARKAWRHAGREPITLYETYVRQPNDRGRGECENARHEPWATRP